MTNDLMKRVIDMLFRYRNSKRKAFNELCVQFIWLVGRKIFVKRSKIFGRARISFSIWYQSLIVQMFFFESDDRFQIHLRVDHLSFLFWRLLRINHCGGTTVVNARTICKRAMCLRLWLVYGRVHVKHGT